MREGCQNHQICCPRVNRSNQPAKLHAGHDVLHALESLVGSWTVVKEQQDSGTDLDHEEKKCDSTEEIPIGELVDGDSLLFQRSDQPRPVKPIIHPTSDAL